MTVLVTGAGGFIGTWVLRELLRRNIRPLALDAHFAPARWQRVLGTTDIERTDAALIDRDALEAAMRSHHVTHVIHLAALLTPDCQRDPFLGCQVNVMGSTAVLDAARRAGVQGISFASSFAVYAADGEHPPMFYGAFKQAVDLIAEQYWRHFGLRSLAIRPHIAYGPERETGLTAGPSLACRAAARGEPFTIGYTGSAGYDWVEDAATAFVRGALECPEGANVCDLPSEQATPEDFARLIREIVPGAKMRVEGPPLPPNATRVPRSISRLFPDWKPTPLIEGVRRTIEFYKGA